MSSVAAFFLATFLVAAMYEATPTRAAISIPKGAKLTKVRTFAKYRVNDRQFSRLAFKAANFLSRHSSFAMAFARPDKANVSSEDTGR